MHAWVNLMKEILLYAAGGHARVVASGLLQNGTSVLGVFDDDSSKSSFFEIPFLGPYNPNFNPNASVILAMGNLKHRINADLKVKHSFASWVDKRSILACNVEVLEGVVVLAGAVVQTDVKLGRHVIINTGACVDHECILEDFVHVSPNATLCGQVQVGKGTQIGAGAVILPTIKIGKGAMIGAGSVILTDVPDNAVYVGNPGKFLKWVS
jgi:sugar O-acyltransferase (sialic acid O-acetyltransferase NeuD family)